MDDMMFSVKESTQNSLYSKILIIYNKYACRKAKVRFTDLSTVI